ncbi:hypothetical protein PHSY_004135 [Pseudozyma hubeiensis SY62]|uniref:Uncharacterized protein n=1 Tax=Pseudozyma hubeiensis (strain SY62) TaxID=1305764 RepID=R9P5F5_PSEHS|nr:hypothetical protein PHSY_004135 [Pseudozyma hubeiensis SY62]GAC96554.1 hypothetical protein PHSY_004135 [Pseudozyma hubeiensis SY62]
MRQRGSSRTGLSIAVVQLRFSQPPVHVWGVEDKASTPPIWSDCRIEQWRVKPKSRSAPRSKDLYGKRAFPLPDRQPDLKTRVAARSADISCHCRCSSIRRHDTPNSGERKGRARYCRHECDPVPVIVESMLSG